MLTIIAYFVVFALVAVGLTQLPNLIVPIFFAKLLGMPQFGQYAGALISWTVISALWQQFIGSSLPIAVMLGAVAVIYYHLSVELQKLNPVAKTGMFTEIFAIGTVGIWRTWEAGSIHWF